MASGPDSPALWVWLVYRLPREPSTPRITVWRRLKRLGVAQVADGVVALPADARTREHLDWIAEDILEAGGSAAIWLARPASVATEHDLAATLAAARTAEYAQVLTEATTAAGLDGPGRAGAGRRLRAQLRRIHRRDYYPPPTGDTARRAVEALLVETPTAADTTPLPPPSSPSREHRGRVVAGAGQDTP